MQELLTKVSASEVGALETSPPLAPPASNGTERNGINWNDSLHFCWTKRKPHTEHNISSLFKSRVVCPKLALQDALYSSQQGESDTEVLLKWHLVIFTQTA